MRLLPECPSRARLQETMLRYRCYFEWCHSVKVAALNYCRTFDSFMYLLSSQHIWSYCRFLNEGLMFVNKTPKKQLRRPKDSTFALIEGQHIFCLRWAKTWKRPGTRECRITQYKHFHTRNWGTDRTQQWIFLQTLWGYTEDAEEWQSDAERELGLHTKDWLRVKLYSPSIIKGNVRLLDDGRTCEESEGRYSIIQLYRQAFRWFR